MNIFRSIGNKFRSAFGIESRFNQINSGGYRTRAADAFDSVWVIGGVEAKAEALASLPIVYVGMDGKPLERLDPKQKELAALLANPNSIFYGGQLWEMTSMLYELDGSAFWVLNDANGRPIQNPMETPESIMVYGTKNIYPRKSADGLRVIGWDLRDGAVTTELRSFQIIRFWKTNPRSYVDGMRITDKITTTLQLEKNAKTTNSNFFKNGARPSGIIHAKDKIDPKELRLFAQNFSNDFSSPENAGKIPALQKELEFKQDQSVRDMDFQKLHQTTRDESFGATRVPKFHLSVTDDINYATAEVQDTAYWVNVIQPKTTLFQDVVNNTLLLGSGMRMQFSFQNVPALRLGQLRVEEQALKVQELKWRIANRAWRQGYPVNVINESLSLGMPKLNAAWANAPHDPIELGAGNQPIAGESTRALVKTEEAKGKNPFDNFSVDASKLIRLAPRGAKEKNIIQAVTEGNSDAMDLFCRSIESRSIGNVIPEFEKAMKAYFEKLQKSQIEKIKAFFSGGQYANKADGERELTESNVNDVLFSRQKWDAVLVSDTSAFYVTAYEQSIEVIKNELGGFMQFLQSDAQAVEAAQKLGVKIVGINDRLRDKIRASIVSELKKGSTQKQIMESVETVFSDRIARVATTARTETGIAMNTARYDALSSERPTKLWVSAKDSGVRASHSQYSSIGSKPMSFLYNSGLSFPQDTRAEAAEIINCRCVLVSGA